MTSILSIDTMLAADNDKYIAACRKLSEDQLPGLRAVWVSRFGALNQIFVLQSVDGVEASALRHAQPPLPADHVLQGRDRVVLEDLRPFTAPPPRLLVQELRAYDVNIGLGDCYANLMLVALETRMRYSPNFGVWRTVTGRVDRIYHLWGYLSLEERDDVRARLKDEPVWQAFVATILPMLQSMQSTLLSPLGFPG